MTSFELNDIYAIEGEVETDEQGYFVSLQRAINAGMWALQGSYGRAMMGAIESGRCMLGPAPADDYCGHKISARSEIESGTKGSRALFVADRWARTGPPRWRPRDGEH